MFAADLASRPDHIISIFTGNDVNSKLSMSIIMILMMTFFPPWKDMLQLIRQLKFYIARPCPYVIFEIKDLMAYRLNY
jgi:hypothetical protein